MGLSIEGMACQSPLRLPLGSINELGWGPGTARPLLQQLPVLAAVTLTGQWAGVEGQATKGPWGRCFPAHQEVSWIWEVGGEGDWVRVPVRADHSGVP